MIVGLVVCVALGAIFGVGVFLGACIRLGNEIDETPLLFEADTRTADLHRELHDGRCV